MATRQVHNVYQGQMQPRTRSGLMRVLSAFGEATGNFLIQYWAHVIATFLGVIVLIALLIPYLSYLGLDSIAKPLFFFMHYFCAQVPSHSFYLFGHQIGLCARNFSIYASMFLGCLIFILSKRRLPGIPWWLWLLLLLPMALDGTTQMFGLRESNWMLRLITGTLFGLGNILFALPMMQKSLLETIPVPAPQLVYAGQHMSSVHSAYNANAQQYFSSAASMQQYPVQTYNTPVPDQEPAAFDAQDRTVPNTPQPIPTTQTEQNTL